MTAPYSTDSLIIIIIIIIIKFIITLMLNDKLQYVTTKPVKTRPLKFTSIWYSSINNDWDFVQYTI